MAAAASAGMIAGAYRAQICTRNSSGYPMGTDNTPNTVANGDIKNPYLVPGFVEVGAPTPTREIAQRRAGQIVTGQRAMGVSDLGNFPLTLADYDETFNALVGGNAVDTTLATDILISSPNFLNPDPPSLVLLLTLGIQLVDGSDQYLTWIYHNVQITQAIPAGGQGAGVNPNPVQYTVIPRSSPRTALGFLYTATTLAVYNNADIAIGLRYTSPFSLTTYIDDGSDTSIPVGYRPVSSEHAGAVNLFSKNGVTNHAGVSAFDLVSGATTHTAGTATDVWVIAYPTNFVAI